MPNQYSATTTTTPIASTVSQSYSHFIGKVFQLNEHNVIIEDVIAEGGFSIVFMVRSSNSKRYALKRMCVNDSVDLEVCKQEIDIIKSLSSTNKKILKYVDSCIQRQLGSGSDIYEILLLTKYCQLGGVIQLMNDRLSINNNHFYVNSNPTLNRLSEIEILCIFCDVCETVADLHANGVIHRDLKVENVLIDDRQSSNSCGNSLPYTFLLCDFGSATQKFWEKKSIHLVKPHPKNNRRNPKIHHSSLPIARNGRSLLQPSNNHKIRHMGSRLPFI